MEGSAMEKIQEMVSAISEAAAVYADEHGIENNDVMNALAHVYVIYGFALKKNDVDQQVLKDALVGCVSQSCDFLMEANDYEYAEEA
jgi:hypothetical protein